MLKCALVVVSACCVLGGCQQNGGSHGGGSERLGDTVAVRGDLYQRLGGEQAIRSMVSDIADRVVQKSAINFDRDGMPEQWRDSPESLEAFKNGLSAWIIHNSGGPARYQGKDMRSTHRGMRISHAEFNAFMAEVEGALKDRNMPKEERKELLSLLESARGEVVEAK